MHKAAALAHLQKDGAQGRDARAGSHALRDGREAVDYRRGRGRHRFCVLRVQLYYEIHVDGEGVPLNAGSSLMLEGTLHVGYVRVLELRNLNGKRRRVHTAVVRAYLAAATEAGHGV